MDDDNTSAFQRMESEALFSVLRESQRLGFIGATVAVEDHVAHASGFVSAFQAATKPAATPSRLIDLGSGGGLPGLVLAIAWPDCDVWLIDAIQKRVEFLDGVIQQLGIGGHVHARHGRAEELARDPHLRGTADLVVARSFGPPAVTAECSVGFLSVDGRLIVSEPPGDKANYQDEPVGPDGPDRPAGSRWDYPTELGELGMVGAARIGGFQVLEQREPCPERYPRRVGIPSKRPLF